MRLFPTSTTKNDYREPLNHREKNANARIMTSIEQQRGALPTSLYLRHHGKRHDCNNITWYDEIYNKRRINDNNGLMKFPDERCWKLQQQRWEPEHSDFPLQGISFYVLSAILSTFI